MKWNLEYLNQLIIFSQIVIWTLFNNSIIVLFAKCEVYDPSKACKLHSGKYCNCYFDARCVLKNNSVSKVSSCGKMRKLNNLRTWRGIIISAALTMPRKNMNLPFSIRMYWRNLWQSTVIEQNIYENIIIKIGSSHTTWWGLNLIERKSSRIAESGFEYLRVCSFIVQSQ